MSTGWFTTMKPTFQTEWLALPPKEAHQVLEKLTLLTANPLPDGKLKKQLTHLNRETYRLESGNYRIIYTLQHPYISLLTLRRRKEDTYNEAFQSEFLGGFAPDIEVDAQSYNTHHFMEQVQNATLETQLPEPITKELLLNLFIPADYHARLLQVHSAEALIDCPGVPADFIEKIYTHLFEKPLVEIFAEKDYLLPEVNDLMRFKRGELLGFLLKLSPEQERYANWGLNAAGPTLLKGGPGTGKSTIALYRVRSLVRELRQEGHSDPRILFTTYTNALARSSEQLLDQLLGDEIRFVQVTTADKLISELLNKIGSGPRLIEKSELETLFFQALKTAEASADAAQKQVQRQTIARVGFDYLREEIDEIITAGQLETLAAYLATPRSGRKLPLSKAQKQVVWRIYEILTHLLAQQGQETWHQMHARAERLITQDSQVVRYDAVVIDEAQDLAPSVVRLLAKLCSASNRLFIAADANQSIYGSHFNWSAIHSDLQFQGRTAILEANYRSTQEIGEAAHAYLASGGLENEPVKRLYTYNGPLPVVRTVSNDQEEAQLLASFLTAAARECKLGISACAILCPTEKAGRELAAALGRYQIEATFMAGQYLNLVQTGVKILTLNSAKGLEFPIVALAGFGKSKKYVQKVAYTSSEEQEERLALERRLLFVGMTRAMRALLVAIPAKTVSPLLTMGFDERYWNKR